MTTWEDMITQGIRAWWDENSMKEKRWQTVVGRAIKEVVVSSGNWKNKARGNPRKAYLASRKVLNEVE